MTSGKGFAMIFEEALRIILKNTPVLSMEKIHLENSTGRVLGENLYATMPLPPFNRSAVDGYAVRAADTAGGAVTLRCVGLIQAGATFKGNVNPGECVKIMTGASVPPQTDSVVMVEDTRAVDSRHVKLLSSVEKNENIRLCGEDVKKGKRILSKGTVLDTSHISLIASMGRAKIKAVKTPFVAVINTGGELIPPGTKIKENKIYNSNGPLLASLLNKEGFSSRSLGIVKDRVPELKAAIKKGLAYDVLLISGGVSVGDYDFVPTVLEELGVKEIFHKLKIKPGKPLYFGTKKRTLVFGIPGNPVPNFTSYWLFIRPALRKMTG
jgi:molybdopterin molybdotransferase